MTKKEKEFVTIVRNYYRHHGRHSLPWRHTKDPYRILVSEIMCQQTQVDRVIPKYKSFLRKFPTLKILSNASLGEVLKEWQGLGYNRRAKMLHAVAKNTMIYHSGKLPDTYEELKKLPGIGPYTAGAVVSFAFSEALPIVETNIRTVYLYHFFRHRKNISDVEILTVVKKTLDTDNPREWYSALMDYGSYIKKTAGNQNGRSKHYVRQSKFDGSDRQIRGQILKILTTEATTRQNIIGMLSRGSEKVAQQLDALVKEGLIERIGTRYSLPS